MADPRRAAKAGTSDDGVRITADRRSRKEKLLLLAAASLVGLSVLGVARWLRLESERAGPQRAAVEVAAADSTPAPAESTPHRDAKPRRIEREAVAAPPAPAPAATGSTASPADVGAAPPDPAEAAPADGGPPTHEEPPFTVGPPGSGIAAFPPPGTDPVKIGIVVPDDFPLPEGYVRHYQVTDDGRDLAPILMFNPDYEWIDADGKRIELPADHIVPPELAPPGLPIRMLEAPKKSGTP